MYSTLEVHYNANKEIEKYSVSSKIINPVLKQCITGLNIIICYENTGPNIREQKIMSQFSN